MVFWSGKVSFVNSATPDKFGRYGCKFHPNTSAYTEIMKLKQEGIMNVVKKDDDGYYINISRPSQMVSKSGRVVALAAVELYDADGKTPYHGEIGNGSDATLKVEVRRYKNPMGREGVAIRLVSIRLDNVIPITADDFPPARKKIQEGLDTAPKDHGLF